MMVPKFIATCVIISICGFAASFALTIDHLETDFKATLEAECAQERKDRKLALETLESQLATELLKLDKKIVEAEQQYKTLTKQLNSRKKLFTEDKSFEVPLKELSRFHVPVFIHKPEFNGDARRFLRVTDEENLAIAKLVTDTWTRAMALEKKNATTSQEGTFLEVQVKPFGVEGEELRKAFHSGMQDILGPDRYEVFTIIGRTHYGIERMFVDFGRKPYRITIRDNGRNWRLQHPLPDGKWKTWFGGSLHLESDLCKRLIAYKPDYFKVPDKK